jgi:hypothetical protein
MHKVHASRVEPSEPRRVDVVKADNVGKIKRKCNKDGVEGCAFEQFNTVRNPKRAREFPGDVA